MVFHYVNAWEEKNEAGDDVIRCYGCPTEGQYMNLDFTEEHTFLKGKHVPIIHRFVFNLTTGACEMTPVFDNF
jgi:carotenoid cleavage dioxygenase-like enzyme